MLVANPAAELATLFITKIIVDTVIDRYRKKIVSKTVNTFEKILDNKIKNPLENYVKYHSNKIFSNASNKKMDYATLVKLCSSYDLAYRYSNSDELLDKLRKLGCI